MAGESQNRVAIVTGGARGIGAGISKRLAADGFAVAILDVEEAGAKATAQAIAADGGRAVGIAVNVTDGESVSAAVDRVVAELGEPTVLINNAGITRDNLLFRLTEDDWDAVMAVNLKGPFLMCRAVQKYMTDAKWGRIVNISSISALGNRGQANYAASKAGIQGFTKTLAIELGKFGVTVNTIGPGFVDTEMTRGIAERTGKSFDDIAAMYAKDIPVGRVGKPEDIAAAVSFFTRDDASWTSGQVIYVTGGPKA
ncbi:MAG: 3-oxoacyl-ACP reductase FabG [Pseudonocardia sp.]|nr:3-oxoacyl-ACP reductase FabG [Pseudonocardia sp.]